jgi:hypothetical protein
MSTKQERAAQELGEREESRREERQKEEAGLLEAVVRENVMGLLGKPAEFLRASSRRLWDNYYRVNVFIGPHAASVTVAHSFFLKADGDGKILTCSPPVARAY